MIALSEHMIGREYQATLNDGSVVMGRCISYIPAKDNDPEVDSIWIETKDGNIKELFLPNIERMECVKS